MSNPVNISYSSANRYKQCPTKLYLSKKYRSKLIPSALVFGKAIESGAEYLLLGTKLDKAVERFQEAWKEEHVKDQEFRPIFDNLEVQFYASDYDKNLINDGDHELLEKWAMECELDYTLHWMELFDDISGRIKGDQGINDRELRFYNRVVWKCCEIRGMTMLKAFSEQLLPSLKLFEIDGKPVSQKEVSIVNSEGDKITGYIDFIVKHKDFKEPIIIDLKTAAYRYPMHALDSSDQLRTYVAAIGDSIGSSRAGYIVLLKKIKVDKACDQCGAMREGLAKNCKSCKKGQYTVNKLDGEVQFITKSFDDQDVNDVLSDYSNIAVAIKNNIDYKNPASCNLYNRPCEYFDLCWKRKKIEEVSHLEEKKILTEPVETDSLE